MTTMTSLSRCKCLPAKCLGDILLTVHYKFTGPRLFLLFILILFQYSAIYDIRLCSSVAVEAHEPESYHRDRPNAQGNDNYRSRVRTNRAVYLASLHNHNNNASYISNNNNNNNINNNRRNEESSTQEASGRSHYYTNLSQQDQPAILDRCCACDEAKYELVFEGLWSRYTHPDDFPDNYWLAYFSDIIGASHSNEFRMWSPDGYASEGVRELAELGITKKLESELKQVSSKTRTIIKARELRYPTLNSKTSAVFRTDRHHHLISILSKLGPSPDWMVGVSGLELCQADCSWSTQRVVNLYLWDAGTDSGTAFMASDAPTRPQDRIRPFSGSQKWSPGASASDMSSSSTTPNPTNMNANFDELFLYQSGAAPASSESMINNNQQQSAQSGQAGQTNQMKPFARLTVTRQRIYEKSCNGDQPRLSLQQPVQPQMTPSSYGSLGQPTDGLLIEPTNNNINNNNRPNQADCRFLEWSDWSSCSSTCGRGIRTRTRSFLDEQAHLSGCSQADLIEKEVCLSECIGNSTTCVTRDWSPWSQCSVDCGQGIRKRSRSPIGPMRAACDSIELVQTEACSGQCAPPDGNPSDQQAAPTSGGAGVGAGGGRCELSEWSQWSECSVACGRGTKIRTRQYVRREDADICRDKLIQKQPCSGKSELCRQATKACQLSVDGGPCQAIFNRWHYDVDRNVCLKFIYGGCLGNGNNFHTFQDCYNTCYKPPTLNKTTCLLPKATGPCLASFHQWYYDNDRNVCEQFIYGGCLGNGNNFHTYQDCYNTCHQHETPTF